MTDAHAPTARRRRRAAAQRRARSRGTSLLIAASLVMLYPLLWMLASSFKPENEIFSRPRCGRRSFDARRLSCAAGTGCSVSFGTFFLNSLIVAVLAVIGNVIACSLAAFAFARLDSADSNFWFALMLGTLMLPYHVTLIPQYVLFLNLDWVDTFLPLVVPKFLAVDAFFIFLMVQFFRGIPRELDEAAMMDGCGPWRIYWKIILPLSLPVLATAAIFTFIWTWDDFFGPLIYLNDMQHLHGAARPAQLRRLDRQVGLGRRCSPCRRCRSCRSSSFFLFFQRLLIEGIATTGMKR